MYWLVVFTYSVKFPLKRNVLALPKLAPSESFAAMPVRPISRAPLVARSRSVVPPTIASVRVRRDLDAPRTALDDERALELEARGRACGELKVPGDRDPHSHPAPAPGSR